jgi:hypothetical protein
MQMDADEAFKLQAAKMERDAVRVDITKRDMSTNLAKLAKAKALLHALDDEGPHAAAATPHTMPVGKEASRKGSTSSSDATLSAATRPGKPAASLASSRPSSAEAPTHAAAAAPATPATTAPRQQATKQLVGAAAAEAAAAAKLKLAAHTTPPTTNKQTASQGVSHLVEGQQHVANMKQHVAKVQQGKQPARTSHPPAKRASFASSFSRAVDTIGLAKTPVAEDAEVDEGGSAGREMELASSASAVLTPRGIVAQDKPYTPSTSEEIASLVYESSKSSARKRQQRGANLDATATQDSALPFIERRSIWNW